MAINTLIFLDRLIDDGYTHLCVVPCSFAKYIINASINNPNIEYVPCASEAVACSVAAGLKIAGYKPIVIVQSSGITNMGSCITSLLNPYDIYFPMLVSWRTYKEGDSEIQHKHLAEKLPNLINAYGYNYTILDENNIDHAIEQIKNSNTAKTVCIMKKNTFTKVELNKEHKLDLSKYQLRSKYLIMLNNKFKHNDVVFIGTTGNTSREMYSFMPDTNNFYMVGNMGGALSLGLGVSMTGKKVYVCGGDAEFVMHMGGLTTAGRYNKKINLTYILFDNESNKSTGGQNTYQNHVDYISIAKSSGFNTYDKIINSLDVFEEMIDEFSKINGANFIHVKCSADEETPRPPLNIVKVSNIK